MNDLVKLYNYWMNLADEAYRIGAMDVCREYEMKAEAYREAMEEHEE